MNLYQYLLEHHNPRKIAVIDSGEQITYGELIELAEGIANSLKMLGVLFQDRVGILADNSIFWVASYLGILKIGAIAVPFPSRLVSDDLGKYSQIIQCQAFCVEGLLSKFSNILSAGSRIVVRTYKRAGKIEQIDKVAEPSGLCPTEAMRPKDHLAALMFTSGSIGQPNAVKVSHQNIIANTDSIIEYLHLSPDDRMMTILPFHYCFGTSLLHTHLRVGGSLVINNSIQFAEDMLNELDTFNCTGIAGVPSIFQNLLRNSSFPHRQFYSLRHIQQAGGKLPDTYIKELLSVLPSHIQVFIMYGQTEATARLSYLPPERLIDKIGSIGCGIPKVILKVLNIHGEQVKPGDIGEIVASGESVTPGYWLPDPNKNPFRDNLLFTGDLAYTDNEGFIYIVGRISDFIKPSGHRVSTASIESVLLEIPEIVEVAVIGIPNSLVGEAAKAFVIAKNKEILSSEDILNYCKKRLPSYAVPHQIEFVESLPKNTAGKILKNILKTENAQ